MKTPDTPSLNNLLELISNSTLLRLYLQFNKKRVFAYLPYNLIITYVTLFVGWWWPVAPTRVTMFAYFVNFELKERGKVIRTMENIDSPPSLNSTSTH